jgi:hypothetical protein
MGPADYAEFVLYIIAFLKIVIPAKAGIQCLLTFWMPPNRVRGRLLKPGMTQKNIDAIDTFSSS